MAQAFLAAIVESAEDAIVGKTLEGIVTSWNQGAEKVFGYTAEEMIGRSITTLIPPDHPNEEPTILERIRRGERVEHYETQRIRKDGQVIDVSLTISPIRNRAGTIIGASKIARDITERKLVEAREREALQQARTAREEADRANRSKDEFLATISHELRTPLTATLNWARMLAGDTLDEATRRKTAIVIERNVKAQAQLIEDLLSNAVKFTPRGGWIHIHVSRSRSHVEIAVTDNGIGIRPEFLPFVFNRFSQADSSITRSYGGLGMGLAITKSIIELHGGSVSASSLGEGQGSTFIVILPIAPMRSLPESEESDESAATVWPPELIGLKVLVVDDELDTCELLRFVFDRAGAKVQMALNAQDALKIIEAWEPDVLVSDIGMPEVDGYELIRRIRARSSRQHKLPAVALTALTRIEDRMKALSAGYQMHVAKPIEPAELLTVVASLAGFTKAG